MKQLIHRAAGMAVLFAALLIAGCATLPASAPKADEAVLIAAALAQVPAGERIAVGGAVATEIGIRLHCPTSRFALAALAIARNSFDVLFRPALSRDSAELIDRLRAAADEACHLIAVPAEDPPPEPAPAPPVT